MLAEAFEDLQENDGVEFKMLFNEIKRESMRREEETKLSLVPAEKTKEDVRDEIEEVEKLMQKLKTVNSR